MRMPQIWVRTDRCTRETERAPRYGPAKHMRLHRPGDDPDRWLFPGEGEHPLQPCCHFNSAVMQKDSSIERSRGHAFESLDSGRTANTRRSGLPDLGLLPWAATSAAPATAASGSR